MALEVTKRTRQSLAKIKKEPVLFVEFEGIQTRLGSALVFRFIEIGDPGLLIGNSWRIGGKVALQDQLDALSFSTSFGSTTTTIDFKVDPDKGRGESVTAMTLAFLDTKSNEILDIVANNEMLGRKVRVLLSPDPTDTVFPGDYITVFRGVVESVDLPPGGVVFVVSHPDQKKRQTIFPSIEASLDASMTNSQTTAQLQPGEAALFLQRVNGPDGSPDTSFTGYIRIDDEIMRYTGVSGASLTGLSRGQLGTVAATHANDANVTSIYRLEGNVIDLALKIMLSGWGGSYISGVVPSSVNFINIDLTVPNTIYFAGVNLNEMYGLTVGDYITTTGSAESANNQTLKLITGIEVLETGSYITVSGVSFVDEEITTMTCAFRSKYDSLPAGLKMSPDEVDVLEHERIFDLFLNSTNYDFLLQETIENGKDFIEKELYSPIACYSSPRKARASIAYTIGPLPDVEIQTLNTSNVKNADRLVKRRSIGLNYYNTIIYKYNPSVLFPDRYLNGLVETNAQSQAEIPMGVRALTIETQGLRSSSAIDLAAARRLARYAFAAEYFENVRVLFEVGYSIEPGDLVILDGESLKIADRTTGERNASSRFYEVISKKIDLQTGDVTLSLLDTQFDGGDRFALISPASRVKSGTSTTRFVIESSFAFEDQESLKWERFGSIPVCVHTEDYSVSGVSVIDSFSGNTVTLQSPLAFTPSAGMIMDLADYDTQGSEIKLLYAFISNGSADFSDGEPPYVMV